MICVEAGLGLDQAFMKVAEELRIAHPELSDELQPGEPGNAHRENPAGRVARTGRRTGLEDIKSLVAMLIQTDRFGTSVAQSLRVYSDELRVKRTAARGRNERQDQREDGSTAGVFHLSGFDGGDSGPGGDYVDAPDDAGAFEVTILGLAAISQTT